MLEITVKNMDTGETETHKCDLIVSELVTLKENGTALRTFIYGQGNKSVIRDALKVLKTVIRRSVYAIQ